MARAETLLDGLDATTRQRLAEAVRSAANRRPIDLYREFGLEARGVKWRAFYAYCSRQRRRLKRGIGSEAPPPSPLAKPRSIETLSRLLGLLNQRIDAGDVKTLPHVSVALRAINDCLRLTHDERAEERAEERHAAWLTEHRRMQEAALSATAKSSQLTPEQVAEIRLKVLGL